MKNLCWLETAKKQVFEGFSIRNEIEPLQKTLLDLMRQKSRKLNLIYCLTVEIWIRKEDSERIGWKHRIYVRKKSLKFFLQGNKNWFSNKFPRKQKKLQKAIFNFPKVMTSSLIIPTLHFFPFHSTNFPPPSLQSPKPNVTKCFNTEFFTSLRVKNSSKPSCRKQL